jgi:hypothetical protein
VEPAELLRFLVDFAGEAGIQVRAAAGAEAALESALCRVRGELWLVLVPADPLEHRIDVVVRALRAHAGTLLEERWLPPAVRERLERAAASPARPGQDPG